MSTTISYENVCGLPGYANRKYADNRELILNHYGVPDNGWVKTLDCLDVHGQQVKCICSQDVVYIHPIKHPESGTIMMVGTVCAQKLASGSIEEINTQRHHMEALAKDKTAKFCRTCDRKIRCDVVKAFPTKVDCLRCQPTIKPILKKEEIVSVGKFRWGKYKEMSFDYVAKIDQKYLAWCFQNCGNLNAEEKELIAELLIGQKQEPPAVNNRKVKRQMYKEEMVIKTPPNTVWNEHDEKVCKHQAQQRIELAKLLIEPTESIEQAENTRLRRHREDMRQPRILTIAIRDKWLHARRCVDCKDSVMISRPMEQTRCWPCGVVAR